MEWEGKQNLENFDFHRLAREFGSMCPKSILLLKNPNRTHPMWTLSLHENHGYLQLHVMPCICLFVCFVVPSKWRVCVYKVQIQFILSRLKGRSVLQFQNMQLIETVSFASLASNFSLVATSIVCVCGAACSIVQQSKASKKTKREEMVPIVFSYCIAIIMIAVVAFFTLFTFLYLH